MSTATATRLAQELRAICGPANVAEDAAELQRAQSGKAPAIAVTPASADEIAAIVTLANEHGMSVFPTGGGTQQIGAAPLDADILLYTTRLTAVEHYDPADLTIGIGAGTTVARLSALVAADQLLFALDAPSPQRCTLGGALSTGLHGPLRHGYGGLRDYCIGIRFVTGDGRKGKGGGRVVKNVAGYDMMKLLIGSQGTLAVITSASFKLFPAPRQTRTFVAVFPTAAEAIAFRHYVLRSPLDPICLELISPQAHDLVPTHSPSPAGWAICVRASGSDKVLARYRKELGTEVLREIEGDEELAFWRGLADFAPLLKERHPSSLLLSVSLPLNGVQTALSDFGSFAEANGFRMAAIGRVGLGHLCVAFWAGQNPEGAKSDFGGALTGLRGRLPLGASMTVLHAPPELREPIALWGPTPTDVASMRAVKAALDPNDVLNRGRLLF